VSSPSPPFIGGLCRHFGTCGGCATQDLPYPEEVLLKEARLREILGHDIRLRPSLREYFYRTRMDFVCTGDRLGLRPRGSPGGVVDLEECRLISPRAFEAVCRVRETARRHKIPFYSSRSDRGYLRYVTVREAPRAGELMLVFLTRTDEPLIRPVLEEAQALSDAVVWSVSNRRADVSFGMIREFRKRAWIEESIGPFRFRFGPNSFFQQNPWSVEKLYEHVAEKARGRTTDLFCGVGGIALFASRTASHVIGIDLNEESIAFAEQNALRNGSANISFFIGSAGKFLTDHDCDTLLLDPPRAGIGARHIRKIVSRRPARVIYVSCEPRTLARELPLFGGYELEDLAGFDLFPRTTHVEVVATLGRVG